jgi:hypothetical protein
MGILMITAVEITMVAIIKIEVVINRKMIL